MFARASQKPDSAIQADPSSHRVQAPHRARPSPVAGKAEPRCSSRSAEWVAPGRPGLQQQRAREPVALMSDLESRALEEEAVVVGGEEAVGEVGVLHLALLWKSPPSRRRDRRIRHWRSRCPTRARCGSAGHRQAGASIVPSPQGWTDSGGELRRWSSNSPPTAALEHATKDLLAHPKGRPCQAA